MGGYRDARNGRWFFCLGVCCLLGIFSCSPINRDDMVKEILKKDPGFARILDKHRELGNRMATYERELTLKRSTMERKIEKLRQEMTEASVMAKQKIASVKPLMEPDRRRLEQALGASSQELRGLQSKRAQLGGIISRFKKTMEVQTPGDPRLKVRQERDLAEMLQDAQRFQYEITAFKEHIRRLKIKLLLIRL